MAFQFVLSVVRYGATWQYLVELELEPLKLIPGTFMSRVLGTFIPQTSIFRCEYVVLVWPSTCPRALSSSSRNVPNANEDAL